MKCKSTQDSRTLLKTICVCQLRGYTYYIAVQQNKLGQIPLESTMEFLLLPRVISTCLHIKSSSRTQAEKCQKF